MNILDKIDILCSRIEDLQELIHQMHELANEPGISSDIQRERYLEIEKTQEKIDLLNSLKKDLFIEAGID